MKILITENQLNSLIDKYITKELKNISKGKIDPMFPAILFKFWEMDGKMIFSYTKRNYHMPKVIVDRELWDEVTNIFSLNYLQSENVFTDWVKLHLGIKEKILDIYPRAEFGSYD